MEAVKIIAPMFITTNHLNDMPKQSHCFIITLLKTIKPDI